MFIDHYQRFGSLIPCTKILALNAAHHLIPKTCHKNKWFKKNYTREEMGTGVYLCRDCHSAVHRFIPNEKELGREYSTPDKLLSHPEISKFVNWISKRDTNRVRTRMPKDANNRRR